MTVLAGWALVLSRLSNQDEVVIGIPSANRGRLEIEGLIGFFVNTLALRIDISGAPTVEDLLTRVKEVSLGAQDHQDLPFEQVVELIKPVRSLSHTPVFQVMFAWQNNEVGRLNLTGLDISGVDGGPVPAKFDLEIDLGEVGGRIVGGLKYAKALFEQATIERWAGYLREVLTQMVTDSTQSAAALPILPAAERQKLLVDWNATEAEYPKDVCVHQLFEAQVARDPAATAVVYEDQSLSYGELNLRANRLAHYLRTLGVGPDQPVAICVERSLEMVVGLLAILKAGGAYVPLDPAYPSARLSYMLKDSAPAVVLTHEAAKASLQAAMDQAGSAIKMVDLLSDANDWASQSPVNPDPKTLNLTSSNLAYIIYTSGSTGQPKGVMVEHKGVVNLTIAQKATFSADSQSRVLQFSSISFDASVFEIVMALSSGAQLCLSAKAFSKDTLGGDVAGHKITHATLPPAVLNEIQKNEKLATITNLIVAGESLTGALVDGGTLGVVYLMPMVPRSHNMGQRL
jgi:non-ribosomal peptide synthetase component F